MFVAIDFDDTITAHEAGWLKTIQTMKQVGFTVFVVTFRQPSCDPHELEWLLPHVDKIVFTGQVNKKGFCKKNGIHVDVWIDDEPMSITHDFKGFKWQLPN